MSLTDTLKGLIQKKTITENETGDQNDKPNDNIRNGQYENPCLLYTSPSPRDRQKSRMPSSA